MYAKGYVKNSREGDKNLTDWQKMEDYLKDYAKRRKMDLTKQSVPEFETDYDTGKRDDFYKEIAVGNWAGACGTDAVIIAYDALLSAIDS